MAILDFLSSKAGTWSAAVWDGLLRAIDARFKPLEEQLDIQRATTDAIVSRGLNVIEDELAPVVAQGQDVLTAINAVKASADDVHDDLVAMRDEGIDTGHILTDATARFTSDAELAAKATPADIAAAIAALQGGASSALDTLNELAAALGDDPDFAGTIIAALGERVRYDAPQAKTASEQAQARTNIIAGHALQGLRSMNALVNPFFAVSQENGRNVLTASVGYGADSTFSSFGSGAFDHGTKAAAFSGMPVPFPFMYETVCTTTGSADYKQIVHTIEADRLVPFGFGTSFAVPSLVACVVEANFTGKVCVTLGNHDGTRSCAIEIDVIADTPQLAVLEFPADTGGSWNTLAGVFGGDLRLAGAASATYQAASAGVWEARTAGQPGIATAATTEWSGATSRRVRWLPFGMFPKRLGLTKAMLEGLTLADWAWLMQPYDRDLQDSQRYWREILWICSFAATAGGQDVYNAVNFPAMRTTPAATLTSGTYSNATTPVTPVITARTFADFARSAASGTAYAEYTAQLSARF